jgi:hypothetical protein
MSLFNIYSVNVCSEILHHSATIVSIYKLIRIARGLINIFKTQISASIKIQVQLNRTNSTTSVHFYMTDAHTCPRAQKQVYG